MLGASTGLLCGGEVPPVLLLLLEPLACGCCWSRHWRTVGSLFCLCGWANLASLLMGWLWT